MTDRINLASGEPILVRDITRKLFELDRFSCDMSFQDWDYKVLGYKPLIDHLEHKHNAPVIITNGATQALHASLYALAHLGAAKVGFRTPYWSRLPEMIDGAGLDYAHFIGGMMSQENLNIDSYLLTAPNNPDGYMPSLELLRTATQVYKDHKIPCIHNAVYYTRTYLPIDHPIEAVGDVQIFSASKHYGLTSLRIGYVVVYNPHFYQLIRDYMELSTIGVSIPAQRLYLHLLERTEQMPLLEEHFVKTTREALRRSKQLIKELDPAKIELPMSLDLSCGSFAWLKLKQPDILTRAQIAAVPGELFGAKPDYVRVNLAVDHEILSTAVKCINAC